MKVLVVDDDYAVRVFFKEFLEMEKKEPFIASNGEEARKMAEKYKFNVIITDLRMPAAPNSPVIRNQGIEFIRFARMKLGKEVRIILMSGDLTDIDAKVAQAAGADFIISKPFQLGELRQILKAVQQE